MLVQLAVVYLFHKQLIFFLLFLFSTTEGLGISFSPQEYQQNISISFIVSSTSMSPAMLSVALFGT